MKKIASDIKARRLRLLIRKGFVALVVLGGVSAAGAAQAQTVSCTISGTPNLNLGTAINVLRGVPAQVNNSFSYSCLVDKFVKNGYGQLCFDIGDGSGAPNTYNPRALKLGATDNRLNFDIYATQAATAPWGTQYSVASGGPLMVSFQVGTNQKATVQGNLVLYSAVLQGQIQAFAGAYSSDFTGSHTMITWSQLPSSSVDPAKCGGTSVGAFGFTVNATVANQCYVTATDLNFGPVSSLAAGPVVGTSKVNVQCTNGTPYQLGLGNGSNSTGGANRSMKNAANGRLVRYDLYQDPGRSIRWGNNNAPGGDTYNGLIGTGIDVPITVYGQAYPDPLVTVGNYSDTVAFTLYY